MSWQTDIVRLVRWLIDDVPGESCNTSSTYSDGRLEELVVMAAHMTKSEISFDQDYTINLAAVTITPDPIALQDYAFVNLTSLKAAAVALKGEWKTQTTQSVIFQDAQTKLDNTEMVKQKKALWEAAEKRY